MIDSGDLRIRVANAGDIAGVDTLLARSYPALLKADYPASVMTDVVPLMARAQPALVTCGTYFVIEKSAPGLSDTSGQIVAAGGWTLQDPRGGNTPGLAHVRHVASDDRFVRQGLGRALMRHIMADAQRAQMRRMQSYSTLTAVPFYEAMGFVVEERCEVPIGPAGIGFAAVVMSTDLVASQSATEAIPAR